MFTKKIVNFLTKILLFIFIFFPHIINAEDISPNTHTLKTVNFNQFYQFGSVEGSITSETPVVSGGTPITFHINIKNYNNYPIAGGRLYIKVFRQQATTTINGPYVVHTELLPQEFNLKPGETHPLVYTWNTPKQAVKGNYRISTYVLAAKDTNFSGLPFMDDVIGSSYDFSVVGTNETIQFDKNNVYVNSKNYYFAAFPPLLNDSHPVTITVPIVNTTKNVATVHVSWKTYSWSQIDPDGKALLDSKEEDYMVLPNQKNEISYKVNNNTESVYYTVGTLKYGDSESVIGVRFARVQNNHLRVNYSGILSYPLKINTPATLFTSIHNTNNLTLTDITAVLTLKDIDGKTIYESTYKGPVSGDILGLADSFIPDKDYTSFILETKIYNGEKLVETISTKYDCTAFGEKCPIKTSLEFTTPIEIIVFIFIIGASLIYINKKKIIMNLIKQ